MPNNVSFSHPWSVSYCADYADQTVLDELFTQYKIKAVIHCAALAVVSLSFKQTLAYYENNVSKTVTLLESMKKHKVNKLIFSSSCAVYGHPEYTPLTEEHPKNPVNPYGTTKLIVEMLLKDACQSYGLEYVALRYFNAAGVIPGSGLAEWHIPETHIIPLLLEALKAGAPFHVFGDDYPTPDGTCIRDYIHVYDIAQAHYKALLYLQKGNPSESFNIGTGTGYSVKQLIQVAQDITQKKCNIVYDKRRQGDPPLLVADPQKAHTHLQWKAEYSSLENCIQTAWNSIIEL